MLLDTGSGCTSPLSIDGIAFGVVTWSTSRISTVQVGQTVLDHYTPCLMKAKFCSTPVMFNEVQFTVILWVKITEGATPLNRLLKCWLLRNKVRLVKEKSVAATVITAWGAFWPWAVSKQTSFWPKSMLLNNILHPFKLPWHGRMVLRKIERLVLSSQRVYTLLHPWCIFRVCPAGPGSCMASYQSYRSEIRTKYTFRHLSLW